MPTSRAITISWNSNRLFLVNRNCANYRTGNRAFLFGRVVLHLNRRRITILIPLYVFLVFGQNARTTRDFTNRLIVFFIVRVDPHFPIRRAADKSPACLFIIPLEFNSRQMRTVQVSQLWVTCFCRQKTVESYFFEEKLISSSSHRKQWRCWEILPSWYMNDPINNIVTNILQSWNVSFFQHRLYHN